MDKRYQYVTCCISAAGEDINKMTSTAAKITYATMRKHCTGLSAWAKEKGYDRDLPLRKDWHVSYHKGHYRGTPCYYLQWSGIEHIWTRDGKEGPSEAEDPRRRGTCLLPRMWLNPNHQHSGRIKI